MYFYLCTDIHVCMYIYICAYTSEQKLSSCLKKLGPVLWQEQRGGADDISDADLWACPLSMQCKCTVYCMYKISTLSNLISQIQFDVNILDQPAHWTIACSCCACWMRFFVQHVAVQFLSHIFVTVEIRAWSSERKECSCACSEDCSCSGTILYNCTINVKESRNSSTCGQSFSSRAFFLNVLTNCDFNPQSKQATSL